VRVALTYDDGPSGWTGQILDILARHNQRATFYVLGVHARQHPELIRRIHDEEHELGNHGFSHLSMRSLDDEEIIATLSATATAVAPYVMGTWRAPRHASSKKIDELVLNVLNLERVRADNDPGDWCMAEGEGAEIAERVLRRLPRGRIINLHDGVPPDGGGPTCTQTREATVEATELLCEAFSKRGIESVPVGELLR
jgi:peptidoglycan/xylan/chitin deacetylase (PgdA/CDA1 family)